MATILRNVSTEQIVTVTIIVRGAVQGVGFRPTVFRLARRYGISGWVCNDLNGVTINAVGTNENIEKFETALKTNPPPAARIEEIIRSDAVPGGEIGEFKIISSKEEGTIKISVTPDLAVCPDCTAEIRDQTNRRYRYPFTNCVNCGPRFTIIEGLPYDRPNTSMKKFPMCRECRQEYDDPANRRFHAQPNACPSCGPQPALWNHTGSTIAVGNDALVETSKRLREGAIVALKGIGGFQLLVDARSEKRVTALRMLKNRPQKPFALMMPSIEQACVYCELDEKEKDILLSPSAPILLAKTRAHVSGVLIAEAVNPGISLLGIMLPYSPLHLLLMDELGFPLVATSGNLSEEPICIDETDAVSRLSEIADFFLVHDRPIVRPADDSVVRLVMDRPLIFRAARGYAPISFRHSGEKPSVLAIGPHQKNTFAVSLQERVLISQHIGDLENAQATAALAKNLDDFSEFFKIKPSIAACDLHPDYRSTSFAEGLKIPIMRVQHHYAHALSCMRDNGLNAPTLAIIWDGAGYGFDKTIWGGEFLKITGQGFSRFAHFKEFSLPGGEKAVIEPKRSALSLLFELFGDDLFNPRFMHRKVIEHLFETLQPGQLSVLRTMLQKKINCPRTSSAGRLFDGVAAIIGIGCDATYEGQAAMALECAVGSPITDEYYAPRQDFTESSFPLIVDWRPIIEGILFDVAGNISADLIAAKFHNSLAHAAVMVARLAKEKTIVLSGGCFQNKYLTEKVVKLLKQEGFEPFWHKSVPPNDGGISLGQIAAVFRELKEE